MSKPIEFDGHPYSYNRKPPTYRAVCKRVKDGDTYEMFVDFGLRKYGYEEIRLRDFDTPEFYHPRNEAEKTHAISATEFVKGLIEGKPVLITTHADVQTYGRFVADVSYWWPKTKEWRSLAAILLVKEFAKRDSY